MSDQDIINYYEELRARQTSTWFTTFLKNTDEKIIIKEIMHSLVQVLSKNKKESCSVVDVGCGEGELASNFMFNMKKACSNLKYYGIDQDSDFVNSTINKINYIDITDHSVMVGNCFNETDLAMLPDYPLLIIASHIAYYAPNVTKFVDNIIKKMGNDTIAVFIHESPFSIVSMLRAKYGMPIQDSAADQISEALQKNSMPFMKILFASNIYFQGLYSMPRQKFNTGDFLTEELIFTLGNLTEFIVQSPTQYLQDTGKYEPYIGEVEAHIAKIGGNVLIWDVMQIATSNKAVLNDIKDNLLQYKDSNGKTSLHWAVIEQRSDIVEYLLKEKIDPNVKDVLGNIPFAYALTGNNQSASYALALMLLESKSEINARCRANISNIDFSKIHSDLKGFIGTIQAEKLISLPPEWTIESIARELQIIDISCFHLSMVMNHTNISIELLERGFDLSINLSLMRNIFQQRTLIEDAVSAHHISLVKIMLKNAAKYTNYPGKMAYKVIEESIKTDNVELVKYVVDTYDTNLNVPSTITRYTPIILAVSSNATRIVKYFVSKGANVNYEYCGADNIIQMYNLRTQNSNPSCTNALYIALEKGYIDIALFLFDKTQKNSCALHFAAQGGSLPLLQKLVKNKKLKASIFCFEKVQHIMKTAIQVAVENSQEHVVEYLKDIDELIEDSENYQNKLMSLAVEKGSVVLTKYLIDLPVDLEKLNSKNLSYLDLAIEHNQTAIFRILMRNAVTVRLKDFYAAINVANILIFQQLFQSSCKLSSIFLKSFNSSLLVDYRNNTIFLDNIKQYTLANQYTTGNDIIFLDHYGVYVGGPGADIFIVYSGYYGQLNNHSMIVRDFSVKEGDKVDIRHIDALKKSDLNFVSTRSFSGCNDLSIRTPDGEEIVLLLGVSTQEFSSELILD